MSENAKKQLDEVKAFMQTSAFVSFKATMAADVAQSEQNIVMTPPDTLENLAACLKLHGGREVLLKQATIFEDACEVLQKRLDDESASMKDSQ